MPVPVPPRWGIPLIAFERITASLADLAKGGNVALALYRDADMDRGLVVSSGKRIFEGPFEKAAARYNAAMRTWWARTNNGAEVPANKLYKAANVTPEDAEQIRALLDKRSPSAEDEARITRFARKYGVRQDGGSQYNRRMLAAFLDEGTRKAARPVMRKAESPADALLSPSAWKKSGRAENAKVTVGKQTFHCMVSQSGGWTGDDWIAEVLPLGNVSSKKSPDAMGSREQAVRWCIDFIKGRTRKAAGAPMRKVGRVTGDNTMTYTCNVRGNVVAEAKDAGYNAYFANGTTAIEIPAATKSEATALAARFGKVQYVFI